MGQVFSSLDGTVGIPKLYIFIVRKMRKIVHAKYKKCSYPYCGEPIEMIVDLSEAQQEHIKDCFVCCHPIVINATVEDGDAYIEVRSENEA